MIIMPTRPDAIAQSVNPLVAAATEEVATAKNNPSQTAEPERRYVYVPNSRAASAGKLAPERPAFEIVLGRVNILCGELRKTLEGLAKIAETLKQSLREQKPIAKKFSPCGKRSDLFRSCESRIFPDLASRSFARWRVAKKG